MTTGKTPMDEWKTIDWKRIERNVFKLQKRIYRASMQNDRKKLHKLQRLLMKSRSARLLAVRRVTQDNQGKKTAGIDGVKSLTPKQRLNLSKCLKVQGKATPVRRVEIPKPGSTTEMRPLGIPTMRDRATPIPKPCWRRCRKPTRLCATRPVRQRARLPIRPIRRPAAPSIRAAPMPWNAAAPNFRHC